MDYTFRLDLYGAYQATFSMGHEALGLWLTEELADNAVLTATLLNKLDQLQNKQCWDYSLSGREFALTMNHEGIEVRAALLDAVMDELLHEELNHYEQESHASCGLDDFRQLLEAWQAFIQATKE